MSIGPHQEIAALLQRVALGTSHHSKALRATKDLPSVDDSDRALLDRWLAGTDTTEDCWELQALANRINALPDLHWS